jgi:gliding motility-associated lipoprotein GldD
LISCENKEVTPKPYGFFHIEIPDPAYRNLPDEFVYDFEFSKYAQIQKRDESNWINVVYPGYDASIHLTYKPLEEGIKTLSEESRGLAFIHTDRADGIRERVFHDDQKNVHGILYVIDGNAASNLQFYMTDSTNHFLRGALYFNSAPNFDSIQPVREMIQKDVVHLIESLEWREIPLNE